MARLKPGALRSPNRKTAPGRPHQSETALRARRLSAVKLAPPLFRQIGIVLRRDKPRTPVLDAFLATLDDLRRSLA